MERWFGLHLYLANRGSRRLIIRLPKRLVDRRLIDGFLGEVECVELISSGDNLILDIRRDEIEAEDWDDGSGWLAALAPLRADVLGGDLRLFYMLWLTAVETDVFEADEPEPMPGIGPMTGALEAFATFFGIDADLARAAAERTATPLPGAGDAKAVRACLSSMTDEEKTVILARVFEGDVYVAAELKAKVRDRLAKSTGAQPLVARTVGELRARARAIGVARELAAAEKAAAERKRLAAEVATARNARIVAIARRGEGVWRDVEAEIERRSATGYDKAMSLLHDLQAVAEERGLMADFTSRLTAIRTKHARKAAFIERITKIG